MATIEEKKEELADLQAVRFISSALVEVSATRMQQLRSELEENRRYYDEIGELYAIVKQSAARRNELPTGGPSQKVSTISVAFTSNRRFYGSINQEIMRAFFTGAREQQTDCLVIGAIGRSIVENAKAAPQCAFHVFEKDQPTIPEMRAFLKHVRPYERVFLYYPVYASVFRQEVSVRDITYTPTARNRHETVEYIYEPELPNILDFFERRVRFLLFQHAMLETELARAAARFVAMTGAEQQSGESVDRVQHIVTQLENTAANRQLLESLIGFSKWKQQ